ncbi:MAG: extracellular solute-binding protein [Eubacteriaceae bacterium]|jgi:phosphate transport system substrate-binding protein|nr:extracellular solute-binding protein [Eubacteriaceae bacterium]
MKKIILFLIIASLILAGFAGCSGDKGKTLTLEDLKDITVVSRESGSGTRGAFVELTGVEVKNADGTKVDQTTQEAVIANKTDVVLQQISGNQSAIGYISAGSLNDTVKALQIDGVDPTAANIAAGKYALARPFFIAVKDTNNAVANDFIDFILSAEGQEVVSKSYIAIKSDAAKFVSKMPEGKIVVAGSSSVTPLMEKLKEAYEKVNPKVTIEIQQSDSTAGITAVVEGTCNIGMASRALKDTELAKGITPTEIAKDGIAVIVNTKNPLKSVTKDQLAGIYKGEVKTWTELK